MARSGKPDGQASVFCQESMVRPIQRVSKKNRGPSYAMLAVGAEMPFEFIKSE